MYVVVQSAVVQGLSVHLVRVEVDISNGLPGLSLIGYLASEVKEAGARVKTALKNSGIPLPAKQVVVNLAPADILKKGTNLDLPIAVAIAAALQKIPVQYLAQTLVLGEISLDGTIGPVPGVLLMAGEAFRQGYSHVLLSVRNVKEASLVTGLKVIGVHSLQEALEYLKSGKYSPVPLTELQYDKVSAELDYADIHGQYGAKRAALIAASGYHNLFLVGPPGSGKTMVASRIPTIMPEMSFEESMELSGIYSAAGLLPENAPLMKDRPCRAPHHTITGSALIGGGSSPKPGEITLSNHGILFLDELTEFRRATLELLRLPLEEQKVLISRLKGNYEFPADFLLVAAANPCPCGFYPDTGKCHCSEIEIKRYFGKISGPLLDRIDLFVCLQTVKYEDLIYDPSVREADMTSKKMKAKVQAAWKIKQERFFNQTYHYNGRIPSRDIPKWCRLDKEQQAVMQNAYQRLHLTARSYHRIIRVARTIADLDQSEEIRMSHLVEALSFRGGDQFQ